MLDSERTERCCATCLHFRTWTGSYSPSICMNRRFEEFDPIYGNHPVSAQRAVKKCQFKYWERRKTFREKLANLIKPS